MIGPFQNSVEIKKEKQKTQTIMAALSGTKNEMSKTRVNKSETRIVEITNQSNDSFGFSIFDISILILSVFSIVSDLCTDLVLVIQYSNQGYKAWAVGTFILIFFPSLIVQFFSLRWYISDKTASALHWILHFCMLGIVYRYIEVIKAAFAAYKSKSSSDIQKVFLDQSDLCMLHLFESFLESAPQLVLQMYVIAMLHEWRFWTGLSALASLLSLAWALAAYTKAQRRARMNKNSSTWLGLFLQAVWRTGMLTSRISTLVLGAYCFGNYIFIIIAIHWIAMLIWIIYQKTDFCETYWEEKIYNGVVGVIYCFCFFNLQEGQSRWRALAFYLVIVFQNLTCLTIFLMWFGETTPKLALTGFITIVGGTLLGAASMLVYYRFFHPSGPIKFFWTTQDTRIEDPPSSYSTLTLRSLKRMRCDNQKEGSQENSIQSDTKPSLNSSVPLSSSVVIVEENVLDDTDVDIKILQDWINEEIDKKQSKPSSVDINISNEVDKDGDAYKRRAICSSVDLVKLIESKTESETDSNGSLKLVGTEEAPSEILSAHDYENLCAVNIARETWGLRSWRGYSDIETWLHDDSVVHDRRLDTLTSTSSDRSGNTLRKENERTRQDDYIDAIADDLAQCESETSSDDILGQYSIDSLPVVYPLGTLDPIYEDSEELSTSTEYTDVKIRDGSASTLVATIDEIRRNTPTQNRYRPPKVIYDDYSPSLEVVKPKAPNMIWKKVTFAQKILTYPHETVDEVDTTNENKEIQSVETKETSPKGVKNGKVEAITGDKTEGKMDSIKLPETKMSESRTSKEQVNTRDCRECHKLETNNKENIPNVASKINHWNKILQSQGERKSPEKTKITPTKRISVKEKRNLFLKKVLSPPNFRMTFQRKKESS